VFDNITLSQAYPFGGTLGKEPGGVSEFALSPNGKLLAQALNNGTILVYDTEGFELIRIF